MIDSLIAAAALAVTAYIALQPRLRASDRRRATSHLLRGCALVWSFDVPHVIQLASGAFCVFYGIQAATAALVALVTRKASHHYARAAGFVALSALAFAAAAFGLPAEGGA